MVCVCVSLCVFDAESACPAAKLYCLEYISVWYLHINMFCFTFFLMSLSLALDMENSDGGMSDFRVPHASGGYVMSDCRFWTIM